MKRLKGTIELLRQMRHKPRSIKVCPRCGNNNIRPERSLGFGFLPVTYLCDDCSYRGHLIIETDKENMKADKENNEDIQEVD